MDLKKLAKRDKAIRQITKHLDGLNELLNKNIKEISKKEKTNKYLSNVKNQFKEYEKTIKNANEEQLRLFNILKIHLEDLKNKKNELKESIENDLIEIEKEILMLNKF